MPVYRQCLNIGQIQPNNRRTAKERRHERDAELFESMGRPVKDHCLEAVFEEQGIDQRPEGGAGPKGFETSEICAYIVEHGRKDKGRVDRVRNDAAMRGQGLG